MALIQRGLSRAKQFKLAGALFGIILITALVAYFGILKQPAAVPSGIKKTPIAVPQLQVIPKISGLETVEALSDSAVYRALKRFGSWPLSFDPKGRAEPFIIPQ